jgi:trk system potassium uptake protein
MKAVIVGCGKVGYNLAESISKENYDVIVIDKNAETLRKAEENLDVMCIKGNGVSTNILLEAGIDEADLLIAVTNSDEINMVSCLTAKKLGVAHTIARIRDPEYARELSLLKEELDLDMVINPEQAAADEIARSLHFPLAINVENFAKGRVKLAEIKVTSDMDICDLKLKDMPSKSYGSILVGVVVRDGKVIVPRGEFQIKDNDSVYVIGKSSSVYNFCKKISKAPQRMKNVMIIGGGRIAYYLTRLLTDMGTKAKIVEMDKEMCINLSEVLPDTLIIHGDGTDEELLRSENIQEMDGCVSITGMDEENLMSALMAKQNGVRRVVAKISRMNYISIVKSVGIDNVICPKLITTNQILKYVRGNKVESLYRIIEGQAEILEFIAGDSGEYLNIPLKKLKLNDDIIVATIVRKDEIVIPHGNDVIKKGDRVIVITKDKNISNLNEIVDKSSGGIQYELQNSIKKLGHLINI